MSRIQQQSIQALQEKADKQNKALVELLCQFGTCEDKHVKSLYENDLRGWHREIIFTFQYDRSCAELIYDDSLIGSSRGWGQEKDGPYYIFKYHGKPWHNSMLEKLATADSITLKVHDGLRKRCPELEPLLAKFGVQIMGEGASYTIKFDDRYDNFIRELAALCSSYALKRAAAKAKDHEDIYVRALGGLKDETEQLLDTIHATAQAALAADPSPKATEISQALQVICTPAEIETDTKKWLEQIAASEDFKQRYRRPDNLERTRG